MKIKGIKYSQEEMMKYYEENKDRTMLEIYKEIKTKKHKERTNVEEIIMLYCITHKKEIGIK